MLIPLFIAIPLAVAFLLPLVARGRPLLSDCLANATMAGLTIMAFASVGRQSLYHMGAWPTPIGIDLRLDPLASLMLIAVNLVGLAASIYSVDYMRRYTDKRRYYSLFLFLVAGMNGVILAGDLFNLYVLMEIAAVASYALVAFGCEHEELEASFKYACHGNAGVHLHPGRGSAGLQRMTGTLNMAHIASRVSEVGIGPSLLFALALFLCGFGLKAALVPFHAWLPDAHPSAPAPVSAMLSGVLIKAVGIYVLARLIYNVFGADEGVLGLLRWLGVISMVVGGLLATGQWDMKRLFAYSSISQVGYIVLGLGLGTPLGLVGALYHLVNHSIFKSLAVSQCRRRGIRHRQPEPRNSSAGCNRAIPVTGVTSHVGVHVDRGDPAVERVLEQADHRRGLRSGRFLRFRRDGRGHEHRDAGLPAESAALCVFRGRVTGVGALAG